MSEFPKMGEGFPGTFLNLSRPSTNTTSVIRKNSQAAEIPGHGTMGVKSHKLETNGATLHPTATLYQQNCPEASTTGRRVILKQGRPGWGEFWRSRSDYGNMVNGV